MNWVVFGHIVKMMPSGNIERSGAIMISVKGDTEEEAVKNAELMIDHFQADITHLQTNLMISILNPGKRKK